MTIPTPAPQSLPASLSVVGVTAAKVSAAATNYSDGATLVAARSNTGIIYIGPANTVTTSGATAGVPLAAGGVLPLDLADLSLIWAISDTAAQGLHLVGMKIEAFTGPAAVALASGSTIGVLGVNGSSVSTLANPVPVQLSGGAAANSATNPIFSAVQTACPAAVALGSQATTGSSVALGGSTAYTGGILISNSDVTLPFFFGTGTITAAVGANKICIGPGQTWWWPAGDLSAVQVISPSGAPIVNWIGLTR